MHRCLLDSNEVSSNVFSMLTTRVIYRTRNVGPILTKARSLLPLLRDISKSQSNCQEISAKIAASLHS